MFLSAWIDHPDFLPLVEDVWSDGNIEGRKLFIFKEKLKLLKNRLKVWNTKVFGKLDLKVDKFVRYLYMLDSLVVNESGFINIETYDRRRDAPVWV